MVHLRRIYALLALVCASAPALCRAGDFVYDAGSIPVGKVDAKVIPLPDNQKITADNWNTFGSAIYSLRRMGLAGYYHGLACQGSAPSPVAGESLLFALDAGAGTCDIFVELEDGSQINVTSFINAGNFWTDAGAGSIVTNGLGTATNKGNEFIKGRAGIDGGADIHNGLDMGSSKITGLANGTNAADAVNKSQLDGVSGGGVPNSRLINTTAPLNGGGDLTADRTLTLTTTPAGQTPVGATRQVATTAPLTGGGALSSDLTLGLTTSPAGQTPVGTTRTITAGNGLQGGGDLSTNRTISVLPDADGSITASGSGTKIGVLATDAQHGVRGGGTQHAVATESVAGFESAADKVIVDSAATGTLAANGVPYATGAHAIATDPQNLNYDPNTHVLKDDGGIWANEVLSDGGMTAQGVVTGKQGASFGTSDQAHVDNGGNLTKIRGVPYSWPAAGGTAGCFKVDASGNITVDATCGGTSTGGGGSATAQEVYVIPGHLAAAHSPLSGDSLGQSNGLSVDTTFTDAYLTASCELPGATGTAHFNIYDVTADAMVFTTALAVPCGCTQGAPYTTSLGALTQSSTHDYRIVATASSECSTYPGLTFSAQLTADISSGSGAKNAQGPCQYPDGGTSRPAATGSGNLFLCTDLGSEFLDDADAGAWKQFALVLPVQPSVSGTFTSSDSTHLFLNQGVDGIDAITDATAKFHGALQSGTLTQTSSWAVTLQATWDVPISWSYPTFAVAVSNGTTNGTSTLWFEGAYANTWLGVWGGTATLDGSRISVSNADNVGAHHYSGGALFNNRLVNDGTYLHFQYSSDGLVWWDRGSTLLSPSGLNHFGFMMGTDSGTAVSRAKIYRNDLKQITPATISAATNANPIVLTTSVAQDWVTGDVVACHGGTGNTAMNNTGTSVGGFGPGSPGTFVSRTDGVTFTLLGSVGNGTYNANTATCTLLSR